MANFSESFKKGLEAAKVAEKNREEVASVFKVLNEQLANETEGKAAIRIERFQKTSDNILAIDFFRPRETYQAITAYNPLVPKNPSKELAVWSQDRAGYPCKIKIGNQEQYFEDKEALEEGLAKLLEDPIVGEVLYQLIRLKVGVKPEGSDKSREKQE